MSDSGNRKNENDEAAMLQAQIDALPDFDEQVTRAFLALKLTKILLHSQPKTTMLNLATWHHTNKATEDDSLARVETCLACHLTNQTYPYAILQCMLYV
jgi:hypothetical protein